MEWILLGALVLYLSALVRFAPGLFAPRCPICGTRLERRSDVDVVSFRTHWHIGWRRWVCPECLFSHRRPVIYRDPKETEYEARALR
jgi:hypothetical protein